MTADKQKGSLAVIIPFPHNSRDRAVQRLSGAASLTDKIVDLRPVSLPPEARDRGAEPRNVSCRRSQYPAPVTSIPHEGFINGHDDG